MDEGLDEFSPQRGTALLVIAMVVVAFTFAFLIIPRAFAPPEITVRVAIIDSGINPDNQLSSHILAEMSFVNQTYGYTIADMKTTDSEPKGSEHGTSVAKIIVNEAPNTGIINAKIVNSGDVATAKAVVAAIRWAVDVQDCDIINLSIGSTPTDTDGIEEIVDWAFRRGVTIVAAAGNNGQGGITGSSVESPAVYPQVIAVGAINEMEQPYPYSGYGPSVGRSLKPDISASGYYLDSSVTLGGTSAAAPAVTAVAANIIRFCQENEWKWTPGMIKATLLTSAKHLGSEAWLIGAGSVDEDAAKRYIESADKIDGLPIMAWIAPKQGIFDFERWFLNSTNSIQLDVFTSANATFSVRITGSAAPWIQGPTTIEVNQSASFTFSVNIRSTLEWNGISARISLVSSQYRTIYTTLSFDASRYTIKIAFDFTHTSWWMDSIFGQFRAFYSKLTNLGIAIEEIRDQSKINLEYLRQFDAIVILDPGAWEFSEYGETSIQTSSIEYSDTEIDAYRAYWEVGGNFLITGGANHSLDIRNSNRLFSIFNVSINYDRVPTHTVFNNGIANAVQVTNIRSHIVTEAVASFDYNGASLNVTNESTVLAYEIFQWTDESGVTHTALKPVLVAIEGSVSSRAVITGTNFFMDNWGLNKLYGAEDNWLLLRRCIYWITGVFGN